MFLTKNPVKKTQESIRVFLGLLKFILSPIRVYLKSPEPSKSHSESNKGSETTRSHMRLFRVILSLK